VLPPEPEAPQGRPRSNAITERPPELGGLQPEPPSFTRPRSDAIVGPPPELDLGPTAAQSTPPQGGWQAARPTAPQRAEPLPLRIGQQRAEPEPQGEQQQAEPDIDLGALVGQDEQEEAKPIDLVKLAHDVLPYLKRLMLVERERRAR